MNVNDLIESIYCDATNDVGRAFGAELMEHIECLSVDTLSQLRALMSDLRIYMISPGTSGFMIRPWSVLGKYVRRCVIVYERMQFDKLVELCKKARGQFKPLFNFIYQLRKQGAGGNGGGGVGGVNKFVVEGGSSQQANPNISSGNAAGNAGTSSRGAATSLFLHDESNLTITSEWFNRYKKNFKFVCLEKKLQ